jgi:hypothetical protein
LITIRINEFFNNNNSEILLWAIHINLYLFVLKINKYKFNLYLIYTFLSDLNINQDNEDLSYNLQIIKELQFLLKKKFIRFLALKKKSVLQKAKIKSNIFLNTFMQKRFLYTMRINNNKSYNKNLVVRNNLNKLKKNYN